MFAGGLLIRHIGILGGMFDPVHNGHIRAAKAVLDELGLDEVRLMPCARPVHRGKAAASNVDRIAMLVAAIEHQSGLEVDARECARDDLSYTYDSLFDLHCEAPDARHYLIMGTDTFCTLETWHRWKELFSLCHIVLIQRPGFALELSPALLSILTEHTVSSIEEMKSEAYGCIFQGVSSEVDLSSTEVRDAIRSKVLLKGLVPKAVEEYIAVHGLY